ncbi:MAG TPA: hypothetical protein VGB13_04105 [Candidatus Krumholzibacteria bacterium]|jgi:hypothetical protein
MRKSILVLLALSLCAGVAVAGEGGAWFDLVNCGMCKNLSATPGMLDAMTWNHYVIDEGMMTVAVVPEQYEEAWHKAKEAMHATGQKMMAGEEMQLCGYCTSFGQILQTGKANMEVVETLAGEVTLVTSGDEATIAMIQEHAKRSMAEMEKMAAMHESR